jgi:hypothetical protein
MRSRGASARSSFKSGFNPQSLGVVGAWFDTAQATNAGSGLAFTLPNLLSSNHATTSTDARKPTISAASNGVPILVCATSCLRIPLHTAINGATKWGIAFHARITSAAGNPVPFSIDNLDGEASARKIMSQRFGGDCATVFNAAGTEGRRGGPAAMWTLNTWGHFICEVNLASGGVEADRFLWRKDGIPVVSSFADAVGTPGDMPLSMPTPTGNMLIGAQRHATAGNPWVGEYGRHIFIFADAMPGARCLLTDVAALALSNFDRPA